MNIRYNMTERIKVIWARGKRTHTTHFRNEKKTFQAIINVNMPKKNKLNTIQHQYINLHLRRNRLIEIIE